MKDEDIRPAEDQDPRAYDPSPVFRKEHAEGAVTRMIEHQTAKLPSDFFLFAAVAAMGASLALELQGKTRLSRFVGMWPSPILSLGIYNKLVKTMGPR